MADSHTLSSNYTTTLEDKLSLIQRKNFVADRWTIEDQVGLSQLLKKGGPQRSSIRRSSAEGQSRTDTGLPPPVFEFVERYHFSSFRDYGRHLWYQRK